MWIRMLVAALVACLVIVEPAGAVDGSHPTHLPGRKVLQGGASSAFCPDGCAEGFCQQAGTEGGLRCTQCRNNLLVDKATGRCACAAGQYSAARDMCRDCPKGSYCPGSVYSYAAPPQSQPCPSNMTTVGLRSTSIRSCVNLPGFSYTVDAAGIPSATRCPADSYSPGFKKQRACVPCPTGFSTSGRVGATSPAACVVPAGYYLKAPGVVAPCPKGEWKSSTNASAHCTSCAPAVTTLQEASTLEADCKVLLPGFYAVSFAASGAVNSTAVCPQAYVCPGGTPRQAGSAASQAGDSSGTITPCPDGTLTQEQGATDLQQCLTPPGHFTADGVTSACPIGWFRTDWKPAAQAASCSPCGEGVQGLKSDRLTRYLDNGTALEVPVMSSADDCYIQAGQGLYFNTLTQTWRAKDCTDNSYGVPNTTFGLSPNPCKPCPDGMVASTSTAYNTSAQYFVRNEDGSGGFASELACVTKPGYGLSGRVAQPCAAGAYNSGNNREVCRPCGFGYTTSAPGVGISAADCRTGLGYGVTNGVMGPCPVGFYNDQLAVNASTACKPCPLQFTTPKSGSDSIGSCSLCSPGYGGPSCTSLCGGVGENATYGPAGRAVGADCVVCSAAGNTAGFSFEWNQANDWFTARTVSRAGAAAAAECLSEYAQMTDGSFYLPLSSDVGVTVTPGVASVAECVQLCDQAECQLLTYDYKLQECSVRVSVAPVYEGMPWIAFKALAAGYTAASSLKSSISSPTAAQSIASGFYTFYQEEKALTVGIQEAAPGRDQFNSVQDCMKACDDAGGGCVGVSFLTTVQQAQIGTTCSFVKANVQPGVFKRSMVRTAPQRLALRLAFLCPSGFVATDAASPCKPVETPQALVLVLTADGTCSAQATETVKAAFTAFFSNPQTAFGIYAPSLTVTVDCMNLPQGQVARRLLQSDNRTMLFTAGVTFRGTTESLPSIIETVQDAGNVQGLETLEEVKVCVDTLEGGKACRVTAEVNPCQGPPATISNGNITCAGDSVGIGETCDVQCNAGYTASTPTITCTAGTFSSARCNANPCQGPPSTISNGNITCVDDKVASGQTCDVQCNSGYTASAPTITCTAGTFSSATCNDIDGCVGSPCLGLSRSTGTCLDVPAPGDGFTCGCDALSSWDGAIGQCAPDTHHTADWTDLTTGLNGQSLAIELDAPDTLVLRGNAFPVIVTQDGSSAMMAAARVSAAGGRVVAFNNEAYMMQCGQEPSPATALTCRLAVDTLRWAAGVPAESAGNSSFRLAVTGNNILTSAQITAIKTAAAALGVAIKLPTGYDDHVLTNIDQWAFEVLVTDSKIADVLLTDSSSSFTALQRTAIVAFVRQGAGLVLGGQAGSTDGDISLYAGNQLLAPLKCIQWAAQVGDGRSITVATTAPDPLLFNADLRLDATLAAQALLAHLQGTKILSADILTEVTSTVSQSIQDTPFTGVTPASSPSAALWASFGSQLDTQLSDQTASWWCGNVEATPENKIAAAYVAKRHSDLPAAQVVPLPCATDFPGVPGAGATTIPSVTLTVNATYAGNYTGPMPPRGGTKWLSTGLWAPAGQSITVTIPSAVAATLSATGGVLGVQIGSHSDDISAWSYWCRLPSGMLLRRWFTNAADGNTITLASGMGGLIYITSAWGSTFGLLDVTVTEAMQAPFFFKGKTTEEEWRATLRSSPVPWAELGSDKFVMTVPSASIANLDNPQAVVDLWDTVMDGYADLARFSRDRPRAERVVLDCDTNYGRMHSGYPIMAYKRQAARLQLPNLIGRDDGWDWFHELGKNHRWSAWTLPNQNDTACDLYALWASESIMKMNRTTRYTNRASEQAAYFASGVFPTDFGTTTGTSTGTISIDFGTTSGTPGMYQLMQLQENAGGRLNYTGGWEFWSRFLTRMQVLEGTAAVATDDAKIQTWIVETSKAANKNLVPFYRTWKFPVTSDTEAAVAALPAFDFDPAGPCAEECSDCCLPGYLSPTLEEVCKQSVPPGWTFHSKMDSPWNDIIYVETAADGNWTNAAAVCGANPHCMGVNTFGGLKHTILSPAEWSPLSWRNSRDPCQGLLVKLDQTPATLPSAMAAPTVLQVGGLCVEVQDADLVLAACSNSSSQLFVADAAPNNNRIQAVNIASGTFCFDVFGSHWWAGTSVTLYWCHSHDNQKWAFDSAGRLVPRHAPNMCLDSETGTVEAGSKLVINFCSSSPSQKFLAIAAAPCTESPTIGNGTFSCSVTPTGQTCVGACDNAYACHDADGYVGPPVATCWNGTFVVTGSASCLLSGPITVPSTLRVGSSSSSLCLQVNGNNTSVARLRLANCTGSRSQPGTQAFVSGVDPNPQRIQTASSSGSAFCLELAYNSLGLPPVPRTAVFLWACRYDGAWLASHQKWTQDALGRWSPVHAPGLCLDTAGSSMITGPALRVFVVNTCSNAPSQVLVPSAV